MPEALAILLVTFTSILIFGLTWLQVRNAPRRPAQEIERLQKHVAWLEERQQHAAEKHWDEQMKGRIATQLDEARRQLADWRQRHPAGK
ncbi:MAG: hypothetical protein HYV95_14155 [Opitutae bacterium]|nr:hypothetical protein [Opitutae bacterium]